MAIITPRTLLIFIVPAFVVVVSCYWLKKKVDEKRKAKNEKQSGEKCEDSGISVGNSVHIVASSAQTDSAAAVRIESTNESLPATVCVDDVAASKPSKEKDSVKSQPSHQTECTAVGREAAGNNHSLNNKTNSLVEDNMLVVHRSEIGVSSQLPFSGNSSSNKSTTEEAVSSPTMHDKSKSTDLQPVSSPVTNDLAGTEKDCSKDFEIEQLDQMQINSAAGDVGTKQLYDDCENKKSAWKDVEQVENIENSSDVDTHINESKQFDVSSNPDEGDSFYSETTGDLNDMSDSLQQMTLTRNNDDSLSQEIKNDTNSLNELSQNECDGSSEPNCTDPSWTNQNNVTLQNQSENSDITRYNAATDSDINTSAYGTANHSPSEDMLESPAASNFSDIHSEGSTDSGKSAGDILMPGLEMGPAAATQEMKTYEFELPQELCGRLIGRQGQTITFIKKSSHANVYIKRHPFNAQLKLCVVTGSPANIEKALSLIRKKFPVSKFSGITLASVSGQGVPVPDTLQLHLPEGIMCDVILSSLINGGHFFLQQPTHPTYPSLCRLDQNMLSCYMQLATPELPRPIDVGVICAAPMLEGWYRALVAAVYEESDECDIKFVDYGGYSRLPISSLRQIRSDFMTLPFQASECYLANVIPIDEEAGWTMEAYVVFEEIAQGQILQAQVVAYAEDCIPYVHLYRIQGATTTFINRELVSRGVALWVEHEA